MPNDIPDPDQAHPQSKSPKLEPSLSDSTVDGIVFKEQTGSAGLTDAEKSYLDEVLAPLTDREREVVYAICGGGRNEEIADRLCIALPTLRTHLMRLNQKLGTTSKSDVVRLVAGHLLEGYRAESIANPLVIRGTTDQTKRPS
ncbi:MAG: helix-turn-helix transcriptional regulator [Phycisphaerales bacterium]